MSVIRGGLVIEGASRRLSVIRETILKSAFTDGGGTSGTYVMTTDTLPAGARVTHSRVVANAAYSGDTSAVITIGDGSDVDRYNTGTPSIFTTGEKDMGDPSGVKIHLTAVTPTITVTSAADFTNISAAGSITVEIWFHPSA